MKFSVATPTMNALGHLRRCVGSVRGQQGVECEHLIQDAKSTDGTQEWLEGLGDVRWQSERDEGMYDAIERAWSRASGDVLSWLNSDEQYLPGALAAVQQVFMANSDVDVVWGDVVVVDEDGTPVAGRREIPLRERYLKYGFLNVYSCATFFRADLRRRGLLHFDTQYRYAADLDLYLRLLRQDVRFHHMSQYVSLFGIGRNNLSGHKDMARETDAIQKSYGAVQSKWVRRFVMAGRYLERAWGGSYRRQAVEFDFATDEAPLYRRVVSSGVGGRYRL